MNSLDQARFVALWNRCLRKGAHSNAHEVFEIIDKGYAEPWRSYHTRNHIRHCLARFDMARDRVDQPDGVEMAIWFHDLVYTPGARDNERRSADLFVELAGERLPAEFSGAVVQMIMDTLHRQRPASQDGCYLVDIDLSSFGLPWDEFWRDSEAVRQEFSHLGNNEFFAGQIPFLRSLLERRQFYYTEFFRSRYELIARNNIGRYLELLRKEGFG